MVAAGAGHNAAVGTEGCVWTWRMRGCLGDTEDRHFPTLLTGVAFDKGKSTLVAVGGCCSMVVLSKGELWAWCLNDSGQLGTAWQKPQSHSETKVSALQQRIHNLIHKSTSLRQ